MTNRSHDKRKPGCPFCAEKARVRKHGFARSHIQRYRCTGCEKTFQAKYIYQTGTDRTIATC